MKALTITAMILVAACPSSALAGRCGLFDAFEGNDYCVSCADRTFKQYACPGGEVGLVAVGVDNPGCSVSYFGRGCLVTHAFRLNRSTGEQEMISLTRRRR